MEQVSLFLSEIPLPCCEPVPSHSNAPIIVAASCAVLLGAGCIKGIIKQVKLTAGISTTPDLHSAHDIRGIWEPRLGKDTADPQGLPLTNSSTVTGTF